MATEQTDTDDAPEAEVAQESSKSFRDDPTLLAYIRGTEASPSPPDEAATDGSSPVEEPEPVEEVAESTEDAGDEPVESDAEVEAVADEAAPPAPWFDARDLQYASALNLTDYDVAQFSSRDEFLRAAKFLERAAQKPAAATEAKTDEAAEAPGYRNADGSLNVEWMVENGYDDLQVEQAKLLNQTRLEAAKLAEQNQWLTQQYAAAQHAQYVDRFHDAVDKLDRPELFGRSVVDGQPVSVPEALHARRNEINRRVTALAESYERLGQPMPSLDELVTQVATVAYSKEISALDAKKSEAAKRQRVEAVARQSTRRRPVASAAGATSKLPVHSDPNSSEAILSTPAFKQFLQQIAERDGE